MNADEEHFRGIRNMEVFMWEATMRRQMFTHEIFIFTNHQYSNFPMTIYHKSNIHVLFMVPKAGISFRSIGADGTQGRMLA